MSHSSKKKIKSNKNEFIKSIIKESEELHNNNQNQNDFSINEYSLFNKKNIEIIINSDEKGSSQAIYDNNSIYLSNCISSPNVCHSMPLLTINSNKNTISSQCPAYGLSNELTNPHKPNEVFELSINEYLKKINEFYVNIKCVNCSKKYNSNVKDIFYLCYNCNKYFCNKCKEVHTKLNNYKENQMNEKHYILEVENLSCFCLYHNEKNLGYCHDCKQNICIKCIKNKIHNSHDIVLFKNILINNIQ